MLRYQACDLGEFRTWKKFPEWENKVQKSIHQFNLDEAESTLPENKSPIFPNHFHAVNLDIFKQMCQQKRKIKLKLPKSADMTFLLIDEENGQEWAVLVEYRLNFIVV